MREGRIGGGADRGDAGGEGGGDSERCGWIKGEGEWFEVDERGRGSVGAVGRVHKTVGRDGYVRAVLYQSCLFSCYQFSLTIVRRTTSRRRSSSLRSIYIGIAAENIVLHRLFP